MAVGAVIGIDQMNNIITSFAVQLRDLMQDIANLNTAVNGQAAGLAYLESLGYGSDANPANPGGISDAAWALQVIGYLYTQAGVYAGTVQQGGTGGTGAIMFDFNQALSPVWGGQVST